MLSPIKMLFLCHACVLAVSQAEPVKDTNAQALPAPELETGETFSVRQCCGNVLSTFSWASVSLHNLPLCG